MPRTPDALTTRLGLVNPKEWDSGLLLGLILVQLTGLAVGCAPADLKAHRPNVILITLDTFRTDVLATYGGKQGLTPWIDGFAEQAVVFERATAPIGTTFPSHASLFTGLYPSRHGVRSNSDGLEERFATLAEILQQNGYATAAFSSMPSMLRRGGMSQGFADHNGAAAEAGHFLLAGEEINRMASAWLERGPPVPFMLWLHYSETHSPYRLTPHAREEFEDSGYGGPLASGASTEAFYSLGREIPWTAEERRALRSLYDGEADQMDRLIGKVMERVDELGVLESSLVIIAADHGQALGEHDLVGHGFLLWQPVVQVPLIVRLPTDAGAVARRVSTRVGLIDLLPTVLELLDLQATEPIEGRSLMPALMGEDLPSRPYFVEARERGRNLRWTEQEAAAVAVFLENAKAIWMPDRFKSYDLGADPDELDAEATPLPEDLRSELLQLALEFRDRSDIEKPVTELESQVEEELRALGYIE